MVLTDPSAPVDNIVVGTTADPALGAEVAAVVRAEDADADAAEDAGPLWLADVWAEALVADVTSVLEVTDVALVTSVLVLG